MEGKSSEWKVGAATRKEEQRIERKGSDSKVIAGNGR
jgi:hypothetical protein